MSQHLLGAPATLAAVIRDETGEPDDSVTGVTVTVTRADGTALATAQAATNGADGSWTYALTASQAATLDVLTATWSASSVVRATTYHEIVGGFLFSLAEARAADRAFAENRFRDERILATRAEVDAEFTDICGVSFVPRYTVEKFSGNNGCALVLAPESRTVRRVVIDGTAQDLASFTVSPAGILTTTTGLFPYGHQNIEVHYEHGYQVVPDPIRAIAIRRALERLTAERSAIPDRATSFSVAEGGTYRLDTAGARKTGNPDIDAVLARYNRQTSFA